MTKPLDAHGWKPRIPWRVIARRGYGDSFVSAEYSAKTYVEACAMADKILCGPQRAMVPPWDFVEIREGHHFTRERRIPNAKKA